jgi:hypothetical protein
MKTTKILLKLLFFLALFAQTTQAQETARGIKNAVIKVGRIKYNLDEIPDWLNKENGAIKYFEYEEDFIVDDAKMCNELGVQNFVIKKGRYYVDYSDISKGGKLIWSLKMPIKSNKKSISSKTFRTAGGKAKHCSIASNCCLSTVEYSTTKIALQPFTFTPIILNGSISSIELQFIDSITPTVANF